MQKFFLYPESYIVEKRHLEVQTVLGSCVSVCLFDTVHHIGGINHFMLPEWRGEDLPTPKYGDIAVIKLLDKMLAMGSEKKKVVAKVFGGAEQLGETSIYGIGKQNVTMAVEVLKRHKIPIVASSVGGNKGRKLIYYTGSGIAYMKYVRTTETG